MFAALATEALKLDSFEPEDFLRFGKSSPLKSIILYAKPIKS
jgi:hypothetical protein